MAKNKLKRSISKSKTKHKSKSAKISNSIEYVQEFVLTNLNILPLILDNLDHKDKIQLSGVNRSLRLKLEPSIYLKIKLFPDNYLSNPTQYGKSLNKRGIQSIFLGRVIETLSTKSHLIKEVVIRDDFNSKFAKKFFSTFCHITHLKFQKVFFKKPILVDILKPLKNLEYLQLERYTMPSYKYPSDSNIDFQLPKTIKTFICDGYHSNYTHFDPLQIIDETYSNLQSMTLINTKMLNQFKNHRPSLVELNISYHNLSDIPVIEEILANNPQITKLSLPGTQFTESLMKSILSLKKLTSLTLTCWLRDQDYMNWTFVDNWAINSIQVHYTLRSGIAAPLLHACKNLQSIQFNSNGLEAENIDWQNYHGSLKIIEFKHFTNEPTVLDDYINCLSLKKIILNTQDKKGWKKEILDKMDELKHWQVTKGESIVLHRIS